MEDFRTYSKKASDAMAILSEGVSKLDGMGLQARKKQIAEFDTEVNRIQTYLSICDTNILEMTQESDILTARTKVKELTEDFNKLKNNLEIHKQMRGGAGNDQQAERQELSQLAVDQVIKRGDNAYAEADLALNRAYKTTVVTKEVVGNIEVELQQQEEQMDRIQDEVRGIKGLLKISNQLLNQIYRRYLTDKCILCLIIVIVLVILFLIIYGALGLDSDDNFNTPDDEV